MAKKFFLFDVKFGKSSHSQGSPFAHSYASGLVLAHLSHYLILSQRRCAAQAAASLNGSLAAFPDFVPEQVNEIQEEAALSMARAMQRCTLDVPSLGEPVVTAYVEETSGKLLDVLLSLACSNRHETGILLNLCWFQGMEHLSCYSMALTAACWSSDG